MNRITTIGLMVLAQFISIGASEDIRQFLIHKKVPCVVIGRPTKGKKMTVAYDVAAIGSFFALNPKIGQPILDRLIERFSLPPCKLAVNISSQMLDSSDEFVTDAQVADEFMEMEEGQL